MDGGEVGDMGLENGESFCAILGSASMTLTLFAEDHIKE